MKGSLTIEASLIYPLIIILSIFTITYCFYCHDKVVTKANAYTNMVQNYFSQEESFNPSSFTNSLDDICLLTNNYNYSYNQQKNLLSITDKYGYSYKVRFSSYERCDFIRQNYCVIKKILLDTN